MTQRMDMKREKISKGFWTGKKRYVLSVYDNEGIRYDTPKISITGIEAVKSSTPSIIRDRLRYSFEIILKNDKDAIIEFINETKEFFFKSKAHEVAFPRGVSELRKYEDPKTIYKKGTPINSRAAILYNHYVNKYDIGGRYYKINPGDSILYVYLKTPNPIHENVIGFVDELPKEFGLDSYIDYDTQFEKTFLSVIMPIFDKIGWNIPIGDDSDLDDFFS